RHRRERGRRRPARGPRVHPLLAAEPRGSYRAVADARAPSGPRAAHPRRRTPGDQAGPGRGGVVARPRPRPRTRPAAAARRARLRGVAPAHDGHDENRSRAVLATGSGHRVPPREPGRRAGCAAWGRYERAPAATGLRLDSPDTPAEGSWKRLRVGTTSFSVIAGSGSSESATGTAGSAGLLVEPSAV